MDVAYEADCTLTGVPRFARDRSILCAPDRPASNHGGVDLNLCIEGKEMPDDYGRSASAAATTTGATGRRPTARGHNDGA